MLSRFLSIFLVLVLAACSQVEKPQNTTEPTEGQPTIGSATAKVHVIVFEEPKCPNCKLFSEMIFPILNADYIKTNKIRYTFVPVSFIPDSMIAAVAWLCVYHQDKSPNHELFFKYVEYTYLNQPAEDQNWATAENMIKFAKGTDSAINTDELQRCLSSVVFQQLIENNNAYGTKLMKRDLDTPTVFVNGEEVKEVTYDNIVKAIKKAS